MKTAKTPVSLEELAALGRDVDDSLMAERLTVSAEAVMYYATQRGLVDSGEDVETAISDLLADLMHLTDACGLPAGAFEAMVNRAEMHAEAERRGRR